LYEIDNLCVLRARNWQMLSQFCRHWMNCHCRQWVAVVKPVCWTLMLVWTECRRYWNVISRCLASLQLCANDSEVIVCRKPITSYVLLRSYFTLLQVIDF